MAKAHTMERWDTCDAQQSVQTWREADLRPTCSLNSHNASKLV